MLLNEDGRFSFLGSGDDIFLGNQIDRLVKIVPSLLFAEATKVFCSDNGRHSRQGGLLRWLELTNPF